MDKVVLSAPRINSAITDGAGVIEGQFTQDEARSLAIQMQYGALPVPLNVIDIRAVGATLGADSVRSSIIAGVIGLMTVLLFMLIYYRLPGLLADIALIVFVLINIAIFKLVPITLTLPGIAGFLLATGMAVDANVLIFARMKEEMRAGKPLRASVDAGFDRAWTAILDFEPVYDHLRSDSALLRRYIRRQQRARLCNHFDHRRVDQYVYRRVRDPCVDAACILST